MSEEKPKPSYYAIIPAHVRYDASLPPNAKLLYGEITALCSVEGYCWASNRYFAALYGVKVRAVQNWIDALRTAGHILIEPIDGYKRHIRLAEAERAAHVKKDTRAEKDTPHAKRVMPPMNQSACRRVKKDSHSITLSPTENTKESIAAVAAPELFPSVFPEQKEPEQKGPERSSLRRRAQGQVFKRIQHNPPCAAVLEQMIQARMGEIQSEDAAKEAAEL